MKIKTDINNIAIFSEKIVERVGEKGKKTEVKRSREEVSISEKGRLFAEMKREIERSGEVREDRIREIKAKLESGQYKVDERALSERLAEEFIREALF